jgi:lipoic acid synthetase
MTYKTEARRSDRLPAWLRRRIPSVSECSRIERIIKKYDLHTICHEALCPNRAECYSKGKVTFNVLGDVCTRGCRFCSVSKGVPVPPDRREIRRVALAAGELGLGHVIVTSVTRDDLHDGGGGHYAAIIRELGSLEPRPTIEVLVPDFKGNVAALRTVLEAGPDILAHNVETVPRLYDDLRRGARYERSLSLLEKAKMECKEVMTKSALILGLGESRKEVLDVFRDLRRADCDFLAIGQYLRPGMEQVPVHEYIAPRSFQELEEEAYGMGFLQVTAGPLVRSSYQEVRLGDFGQNRSVTCNKRDARRKVI